MTDGARRGVTRGYVGALIFATIITAVALIVAVWGSVTLLLGRDPVEDGVPRWVGPIILLLVLAVLAAALWRQALTLLRGRRTPAWANIISTAGIAYLVWSVLGMLAGMHIEETWLSPHALALAVICIVSSIAFWAVLARRVYTDKPPPRWPWERDEGDE